MNRSTLIMSMAVGLTLVAGGTVWAKPDAKEKLLMAQHATVTAEQAIKSATERVSGKVVEAELEKKHEKIVWEVEVATADNRIIEVHVDSKSGKVIDVEEEGRVQQ